MDWGTQHTVGSQNEATAYVAERQTALPPTKSAYTPSGKLPAMGILWLALGAALGVPAGAISGVILGGITMGLVTLLGFLLGLMAAVCGRVLCIVVAFEVLVAVVGAALTFASIGIVAANVTAWAGRYGKNRNTWAATLVSLPAALVAFVLVALVPQVAAYFVGPADPAEDFALSSLVHLLADPSWLTLALYGLGLIVTLGMTVFSAHEAVGAQKFCEPCERYMDDAPLRPMSFDIAKWAIEGVRRNAGAEVAQHVANESGPDVEVHVFACPSCARGYFEATAHVVVLFPDPQGKPDTRTEQWLCASIETQPETTRALVAVKQPEAT